MRGLLGVRIVQIIPTLLLVSVLVFLLQELMPGDPARVIAGEDQDPQAIAQIRAELWLDRPVPLQYVHWLGKVLHGDLGYSWRNREPVMQLVEQKLPVTLQLSAMAFIIAVLIGVPAGVIAAVERNTVWDWLANAIGLAGLSTPTFWLGIMLILLVSVDLGWLPPSGYVPLAQDWVRSLATTIMPAFVLGNAIAAVLMRHTRSAMLSALGQDYVRTARAKGLAELVVITRHALRNALIPVVTLGALELGTLLSGAVLTEQVFSIPGLRQADRRCSVQQGLSGGPGRRAGDGVSVCGAEFACRRAVRGHQPTSAGGVMRVLSKARGRCPHRSIGTPAEGQPSKPICLVLVRRGPWRDRPVGSVSPSPFAPNQSEGSRDCPLAGGPNGQGGAAPPWPSISATTAGVVPSAARRGWRLRGSSAVPQRCWDSLLSSCSLFGGVRAADRAGTIRSQRAGWRSASRRPGRIGWAPTSSGATCCRG